MKPRVIIVDQEDNIIGYRLYKEIDFPNEIYRVSRLWVIDSVGNVLLQKRGSNVTFNQGLWSCAVGGTNDEGETYDSNIIKEADEEIGLVVMPLISFDPEEVAGVTWFSRSDLEKELSLNPGAFAPEVRIMLQ